MAFKFIFLASLLILWTQSIQIPLTQGQFQCMLVYSGGHDETVKIDINFPMVSNWTEKDKYYLTLRNTKTNKMQSEDLSYGHFRRQINLYERIIYEICFQFLSPRQINEEILVDYDADTHYMIDKNSLKIPENLLKADHMRQTYENALVLKNLTSNLIKLQKERAEAEQRQFKETQNAQNKIIIVSLIEIGLILAIGFYQFCQLKNRLVQNQYSSL